MAGDDLSTSVEFWMGLKVQERKIPDPNPTEVTSVDSIADYEPGTYRPKDKRVLIVNNDREIAESFGELLQGEGYQVSIAFTGNEVMAKLTTFNPDLLILDLCMPELDAFWVCAQLRGNPEHSLIKILAIAGYAQDACVSKVINSGADFGLAQPVPIEVLKSSVAKLFEHKYPIVPGAGFLLKETSSD